MSQDNRCAGLVPALVQCPITSNHTLSQLSIDRLDVAHEECSIARAHFTHWFTAHDGPVRAVRPAT